MESPEGRIVIPGRSSPTPAPAVCALCLSAPGKYTCPRCNAPYCSLACYKGGRHSACSELFYKEAVLQALREEEAGCDGRRRVEEMLVKLREEEDGGGREEEDGGLWSSLSRQEKEHFLGLLQSGHIGVLVPEWRPWWDRQSQGDKILELPESRPVPERCPGAALPTRGQEQGAKGATHPTSSESPPTNGQTSKHVTTVAPETVDGQKIASQDSTKKNANGGHRVTTPQDDGRTEDQQKKDGGDPSLEEDSIISGVPPLLGCIPPLCSLTRSPSPLVRFTLVNVIYGYSFSLLRHNGDLSDDEMMSGFMGTLLSVSGALSTTIVYNSAAHALKSGVRAASDPLLGGDEGAAVLAMEATAKILLGDGGKRYALAALSHLHYLLGKIRKVVTEEKDAKKRAFIAKKKCLFLAAWVNENGGCLPVLSAEVTMEYEQHCKDLKEMAEISTGLQRVWGGKRPPAKKLLIQEVN
ncbi:zinc finger HIT domain-containing protein 2 [Anomaloglossus baeobatrachus]|uniref:zinc finger HIT domain-containing protein 2 n=1 Tax=Anomaloglossus baeobatrachus TaxID=238106 RepID=UPI003F4F63C9